MIFVATARRESCGPGTKPLVGVKAPGFFSPNYVLIDARRAIQNRFITNLISVRHNGFVLGRGIPIKAPQAKHFLILTALSTKVGKDPL